MRHVCLMPVCLLLSCHAGPQPVSPEALPPLDLASVPAPPVAWEEMDASARKRWMNESVVPTMERLWLAYDAERFADFGCPTCHGDDFAARAFAMPNPSLLPLHPTGSDEQQQVVQDHPRMVRFMYSRVVPAMQKLLGAAAFDEATGEGFSCYACHPSGVEDG